MKRSIRMAAGAFAIALLGFIAGAWTTRPTDQLPIGGLADSPGVTADHAGEEPNPAGPEVTPEEFRSMALSVLHGRIESAGAYAWRKSPAADFDYRIYAQTHEYALVAVTESLPIAGDAETVTDEFRVFPRSRRIDWRRAPIVDFHSFDRFVEDSSARVTMRRFWGCPDLR